MIFRLSCLIALLVVAGCKTKADIRRENEFKKLQYQMTEERAKLDEGNQELKQEVARINSVMEQLFEQNKDLREQVATLNKQLEDLKEKTFSPPPVAPAQQQEKTTYAEAKALFDDKDYPAAAVVFRKVLNTKISDELRADSRYLLAESLYAQNEYREAVVELSKFRKENPRDERIAKAIYRQANCFKNLKMNSEAKLFYEELIEGFPKDPIAAKAKKELKSLKQ